MKKSFFLLFALLGLLFTGVACTVEELVPEQNGDENGLPQSSTVTISATLEQTTTKTAFGDSYSVCWSANDQIRIFNASTPAGVLFTLTSGEGTTSATFSGNELTGDGPFYAVYPASAASTLSGGAVSLMVPGTQAYAPGSFGKGYNISASQSEALTDFSFKNVGGLISFSLTGNASVRRINLYTKANELLNGSASVSFTDGVPSLSWSAGQSGDAFKMMSLDCGSSGVALNSSTETLFYMVLPNGSLSAGFTIEVIDNDETAMVKNVSGNSAQIVRSSIRPMPAFAYSSQYKAPFLLSANPAGAFSGVLANEETFAEGCSYSEDSGQYSYLNTSGENATRYLRIQDWSAGFALGLTTPYSLNAGGKASVTVEALGATGVNSLDETEMKVLKIVGNRAWIADPNTGYGFIMMLVED